MMWVDPETNCEIFDRDCAVMEKSFSATKCDDRALSMAFRGVTTVITRRIGKRKMCALMREVCADLDLVSAAPDARLMKRQGSAARRSSKICRAAVSLRIANLMSSFQRLEKSMGGFALCAKIFCKICKGSK